MKKPGRRPPARAVRESDTMRAEYDFSKGKRGEYAARYAEAVNTVSLDADVCEVFRDSRAVNEALRTLIRVARKVPRPRASRRPAK